MQTWTYFQIFLDRDDLRFEGDANALPLMFERMLLDIIQPLIQYHRTHIHQYFFMRYFEEGFHIRLRLYGDSKYLINNFGSDLRRKTISFYNELLTKTTLMRGEDLVEAGYLKIVPYEPEYDKYGGPLGVQTAEAYFQLSSEIVFSLMELQRANKISINSLLYLLTKKVVEQVFQNKEDRRIFLDTYGNYWVTQIPYDRNQIISELEQTYLDNYKKLKIIEEQGIKYLSPIWIESITSQFYALINLEKSQQLTSRILPWLKRQIIDSQNTKSNLMIHSAPLSMMCSLPNYLHMLHNRAGLPLYHELRLIYFVIREWFDNSLASAIPTVLEPGILFQSMAIPSKEPS